MTKDSMKKLHRSPINLIKFWCAISCLGISVLAIGFIGYSEFSLQTDYPKSFNEERFKQIAVGMQVEKVFNALGYPFCFRVPSLGARGYFTNIIDVRPFFSREGERVVLEYSRPRSGDAFQARQIVVTDGCVIRVDGYKYWGD